MKNTLLKDFYIGFIRIHILYHANREAVYGSALMRELSRHGYQIGPGTLYPVLHGLETNGLLVSENRIINGKRRRYYNITTMGQKLLEQARHQVQELINEVNESA